jgi:glycine cleavage system H lipoate-binding protein/ABC-type phosphate transport system substrate-binding protein
MKSKTILLISLILMNYAIGGSSVITGTNLSSDDSVRVLSTPDLCNLAATWAVSYNKSFPESKISVTRISDEKTAGNLLAQGYIGFVTDEYYSGLKSESLWKLVVGRDIIVPVINSKNPFLKEIEQKGISPAGFGAFFSHKDSMNWGTLLRSNHNSPADFYLINDKSISKGISEFVNSDKVKIHGIEVENAGEMIAAVQKDPYALGFCKMINIFDINNQSVAENICLLPVDRNGNGTIDYNEKIYDDINNLTRGVWIGKYPKALFNNIYSVSSKMPENQGETAFLKWIITEGQQYLYSSGYSDLILSERQTTVDKLNEAQVYSAATGDENSLIKIVLALFAALITAGFIVDMTLRYMRRKKSAGQVAPPVIQPVLDENSLILPKGIYFDKTHTWAFMEQTGVVKVGIDDFLQHITGTLSRVKMKDEGYEVKKGELILSIIQNGKQLNVYAPISGKIIEKNSTLDGNASMLNSSPYIDGWVYRIEPTNWRRENQLLFMADKHRKFITDEISRLKDFLAGILSTNNEKYARVILQDGGQLVDSALSNLSPEVWEEFQLKFIDPSRKVWFYELF